MRFKFNTLLFSAFSLSSSLQADTTVENPLSPQQAAALQDVSSKEPLDLLQDIHHFESTFDNYHLGGIRYESFK